MKKSIKIVSTVCAAIMAVSASALAASADVQINVPIRIEGIDGIIFYETVKVSDSDGSVTAADALIFADKQSDSLEIKGADAGYITEVNGTAAGKFGGYDGWYYAVDGKSPSVGVNEYVLKDGESLVLYYGGYPCQIPYVDDSKLGSDGILAFKSNDTEYDENWNATEVVNPVTEAEVTVNGTKYTTDKNGEIKPENKDLGETISLQIAKNDSTGAPALLRFAPDYAIAFEQTSDSDAADSDTDTAVNTDTDSSSDNVSSVGSDTDTSKSSDTSSDKTSDSEKDNSSKESSSKDSSSKAETSSISTVSRTTTVTQTAPAAATTASVAEPASTGDGRTYIAFAVFGVAAIVIIVMVLLGLKKKKDQ